MKQINIGYAETAHRIYICYPNMCNFILCEWVDTIGM